MTEREYANKIAFGYWYPQTAQEKREAKVFATKERWPRVARMIERRRKIVRTWERLKNIYRMIRYRIRKY